MSQFDSFTKSNLIYIPLSITIAHTLHFIFNSPLSTWQEFPPNLPTSVYSSICYILLLLFISLTFEPIHSRTRFYTLLSLLLIFISIPISFRGKYPPTFQVMFVMYAAIYGSNMLMFLKSNRAYLNQEELKQKKEFKSFLWTLFNLRFNSYIIPPKKENTNERGNSLMIASPTTSQINKKIINRTIITFTKWVILELAMIVSIKYTVEIPEKPYQLRLLEFFTKGIPAITLPLILAYFNTMVLIYLSISLNYDIFTIFTAILYRLFFHSSSIQDSFLIKMWILTPSEYVSLKEWIITFLFNTKHMFSEPWLASSPRDFWSVRWQLVLNGFFKELGYLPVRNLVAPFVPRKIANMMGVLGALGYSAIIHEYIILGQFDHMTGEHFFFFMIHGVIFILWEAVFGRENKNENAKIKRFLKWVLLMIINLLVLPAFIEPLRRRPERFDFPYARARYYLNL